MTTVVSPNRTGGSTRASTPGRARALAERLEQGANALAALASTLTDAEWRTPVARDGRSIGVVVNHVATVYPLEIKLALAIAAGEPITGVTMDDIHAMNAAHAKENASAAKAPTIDLLRRNSADAAQAIRELTDEGLDRAETASLYDGAPVTAQFVLEDHAVRHSYHHLDRIRLTLGR